MRRRKSNGHSSAITPPVQASGMSVMTINIAVQLLTATKIRNAMIVA